MAQSRSYFLQELQRMGFKPHFPQGDIYKYIPKDYFKLNDIVVCLSAKGTSIEVTVYEILLKSFEKFSDYSSAWQRVNQLLKQLVKPEIIEEPKKPRRSKRKR